MIVRLAAASLLGAASVAASTHVAQHPVPASQNVSCRTEDSSSCYWDAAQHGDGTGWSFYSWQFAHRVCITYVLHPGYDYCTTR